MRPTKNDRLALMAMQHSMAHILGAVAPDVKRNVYDRMKKKSGSWELRNSFGTDGTMSQSTIHALSDSVNDIRNRMISMRKNQWTKADRFRNCVERASDASLSAFKSYLMGVKPNRHTTAHYVEIGRVTERVRPTDAHLNSRHFTVSPGWAHFVRKLGTATYRRWLFLSGEPIASPFDGTMVWGLTTYDYTTDTVIQTFGGTCDGDFIARPTVSRCVNELRRIAAKAVFSAMSGESNDEEV
jgi:hypothetical protein